MFILITANFEYSNYFLKIQCGLKKQHLRDLSETDILFSLASIENFITENHIKHSLT